MAFQAKTDFFGIGGGAFVLTESNENRQSQVAEGYNEKGDIVAIECYGDMLSPQCTYLLSADAQLSSIQPGKVVNGSGSYQGKKFTVGSISLTTQAGSPPSIQASGEEVPASTTHSDCYYTFPAVTIKACHHAQILDSAFSMTGEGCYLQSTSYTFGGTISRGTKNGETISFDVTDGKLECQATILQTGSTAPTVTAGNDWTISQNLSKSEPDADYPSWTVSLIKCLEHAS